MPASQYLADSLLNWFRNTSFVSAPGSNIYISLHSADPGAVGVNNDVTLTVAASRAALPTANLTAPAASPSGGRQVSNTSNVLVTSSALAPAQLTYFGIWNAASAGDFLAYGRLDQPVNVLQGDVIDFPPGLLVIPVPTTVQT